MTKWGTASELRFIESLGTGKWSNRFVLGNEFRIEMLKGYLEGLELRKRWDGIDKKIVKEFAEDLVNKLKKKTR